MQSVQLLPWGTQTHPIWTLLALLFRKSASPVLYALQSIRPNQHSSSPFVWVLVFWVSYLSQSSYRWTYRLAEYDNHSKHFLKLDCRKNHIWVHYDTPQSMPCTCPYRPTNDMFCTNTIPFAYASSHLVYTNKFLLLRLAFCCLSRPYRRNSERGVLCPVSLIPLIPFWFLHPPSFLFLLTLLPSPLHLAPNQAPTLSLWQIPILPFSLLSPILLLLQARP